MLNTGGFSDQVKISNICTIPARFLPSFVDGVPILVNTKQKQLYKGTDCLTKIKSENTTSCVPAERMSSSGASGPSIGSFVDGKACIGNMHNMPEDLFLSGTDVELNGGLKSIEEYQKLREQSVPKAAGQQRPIQQERTR